MLLKDFIRKINLKNKTTSNMKIQQMFSSLSLKDVKLYLRGGLVSSDIGIIKLHPTKGTHWAAYKCESYFDSHGCGPPNKLSRFVIKRNGFCLYSDYKIRGLTCKRDSFCAAYCLYLIYLTKVLGTDFKSAVLKFYYQSSLHEGLYGK